MYYAFNESILSGVLFIAISSEGKYEDCFFWGSIS